MAFFIFASMVIAMVEAERRRTEQNSKVRPAFAAVERKAVRGVGYFVSVELDRDTDDFAYLIGKRIIIDGRLETCLSVQPLSHAGPCKAGERVNLCIRESK
jgi:hypothetical protein